MVYYFYEPSDILLDEVLYYMQPSFGVSGGFFQGAKLRTLVYVIKMDKNI